MANVKISELTAASTPLAGTEVLPIVQSGGTVKVSVANLTAGRAVSASSLTVAGVGTFNAVSFAYNTSYYNTDNQISNYAAGNYLYVSGNGTTTGGLYLQGGGNQKQAIIVDGISTGGNIAFQTNGSEKARITSTGEFCVGTTSNTYKVNVTGAVYASGTFISGNPTPVTAASVGSNPGTAAIWDGSGNLYKQSSSMRYKENIAEWNVTDAQLDAFVNLSPKLWDYTGKQNGCAGFIAEDIEALGLKNAYNTSPLINYSNEGEPDSNRDFALIALQHKVIQRLEATVKELKARLDAANL
jgi:hypothetical protein